MSGPLGSQQWMYNAGGAFYPYSIDQSLRFNDDDSAYLSRTPASAGNLDAWTFSAWVKRGNLGVGTQTLFGASSDVNNWMYIGFTSANVLTWNQADAGSVTMTLTTSQVFRDVGSFYHILCKYDSAQATAADRQEIYINGTKITAFGTATRLGQNVDSRINRNIGHTIGRLPYSSAGYFDGYMAEVNFIDGTALDATSFGETINGIWVPKAYSGSYGTNGFYLSFADSAAIGDDLSGNTNDFTATNLAASDVVPDSPTNNMAVLSTVSKYTNASSDDVREGGLEERGSSSGYAGTVTFDATDTDGYYYEVTHTGTPGAGCTHGMMNFTDSINQYGGVPGDSDRSGWWGVYRRGAGGSNQFWYYLDGVETATLGVAGAANDVWMYLIKDGKFYIGRNGTWFNSADPSAGTGFYASGLTGTDWTIFSGNGSNVTGGHKIRVDRNLWDYGDASYKEIKTSNIAEPTIGPNSTTQSDDYFNTVLYTGNGTSASSTQAITGVGFQPDFLWTKSRSLTSGGAIWDVIRGDDGFLVSHVANAENTTDDYLSSFDTDGFTLKGNGGNANANGATYVAWNWKVGGTAVSNTDGSITSSVLANQDAGISIATWTGNQIAGATVGHGLSQAPEMYIVKARGVTASWAVYHSALGATKWLLVNSTQAATTSSQEWNNTEPTSTVVSLGTSSANSNQSTTYVGYFFHSVEGHLKCASYVGNGSTNGTFVYTGFRPAFVLTKESTSTSGWNLRDNKRSPENVVNEVLQADTATYELTSGYDVDFLSNGFKLKTSLSDSNTSGQTYIYLAFAEAPFKYANAR